MTATALSPAEKDPFKIVFAINQLVQGRSNAVGEVTLRLNETTTVVPAPNCAAGSHVFLFPRTAAAAGELGSTYVLSAKVVKGQFTITHDSNATVGRTFSWIALG